MNVDLPAPFCPTRQCTSPARTSRSTPSSARTPGKSLTIPSISRRASLTAIVCQTGASGHRPARRRACTRTHRGEPLALWRGPNQLSWNLIEYGKRKVIRLRRQASPSACSNRYQAAIRTPMAPESSLHRGAARRRTASALAPSGRASSHVRLCRTKDDLGHTIAEGKKQALARAQHVFDGELVELGEVTPALAGRVGVEVFESRSVCEQVGIRLAFAQRRDGELGDARS